MFDGRNSDPKRRRPANLSGRTTSSVSLKRRVGDGLLENPCAIVAALAAWHPNRNVSMLFVPPFPAVGRSYDWCGRGDLNPHALAGAATSRLCVCQFRHFRSSPHLTH
jgi:hypothetical protein